MEMLEYRNSARGLLMALEDKSAMEGISSNVQEQIPSAFRGCECKKYENDRGLGLLSAKVCTTSKNFGKVLRITVQNILSSSREN